MSFYASALVVDRSDVARELLSRYLRTYCKQVGTAESIAQARSQLGAETTSLVLLDATAEGALAWLEECGGLAERPTFAVTTQQPTSEEETQATLLGAVAYLAKPISYRELAHALMASISDFVPSPARARTIPLARVSIYDPSSGEPQLACSVTNLSVDGAFVEAAAPIPNGTQLSLQLRLADTSLGVRAQVVRIQEPTWGVASGWGVRFEHDDEASRQLLERFVSAHLDQTRANRGY